MQIHLGLLAEKPELGTHFRWVEAGVRGCWFDSLGVVFKLHISGSLKTRLVLLNEQCRVLQGDKQTLIHIKETDTVMCEMVLCFLTVNFNEKIKENLKTNPGLKITVEINQQPLRHSVNNRI